MSVVSAVAAGETQRARPQARCRAVLSPRAQARRLLASRGVSGEAQHRALATLWALAVSSREGEGAADGRRLPVAVHAGRVGERLGLPKDAVAAAVADLLRADLLEPDGPAGDSDGQRVRLRPLEGLDEAVAHLSRLMRIAV
jgi:hypothetical protein